VLGGGSEYVEMLERIKELEETEKKYNQLKGSETKAE
jgi:hypothetical protein